MAKGLKCPKCRQQTAHLTYGTGINDRRYKQKLCYSCGYKGAKRYRKQYGMY